MTRAATTIKVRPQTHARLQEMAREENQTIGEVISTLVDRYDKERFWDGVSEDLAKLKADKKAYNQYRNEFAEWDNQTTQSLSEEPPYHEEGEE